MTSSSEVEAGDGMTQYETYFQLLPFSVCPNHMISLSKQAGTEILWNIYLIMTMLGSLPQT